MEVRFVTAVTRGFFFPLVTIGASPLNFHRKQQEKKPLATRIEKHQQRMNYGELDGVVMETTVKDI